MLDLSQQDAAHSLGLSRVHTFTSILLPQAIRFSLPGLANEYSVVLKDSALAFAVGVVELMSRGTFLSMTTKDTTASYLIIAAMYSGLTQVGVVLFRLIEQRRRIPGLGGGSQSRARKEERS